MKLCLSCTTYLIRKRGEEGKTVFCCGKILKYFIPQVQNNRGTDHN